MLSTFITEFIYHDLDNDVEARVVGYDISKPFDRLWYAETLHKPRNYVLSDWLFAIIQYFFFSKNIGLRIIVLNGQPSRSFHFNAGVPQALSLYIRFFFYLSFFLVC